MAQAEKVYIIVLGSLTSGQKMAQACHAITAFTFAHPEKARDWFENSNNIVVLEH